MAFPLGTEPITTMSASTPDGLCAVSPPANGTENCLREREKAFHEAIDPMLRKFRGKS